MDEEWRDDFPTNKDKILYMYRNNMLTDCGFVVGEGKDKKVFRAHKFVLSLVSAVFQTMFYGSVEQDADNIRIHDVDPDVFQTFLDAIYTEELVPRSFKEACYLLDLASKYMIQGMTDQCLSYMERNINPLNAAAAFEVLSLYEHMDLAAYCWKVIQQYTSRVLNSEDFTDLGFKTVVQILDEDELAVESEGELVSAVERWVDAELERQELDEETDRLALLSDFLPYIRFTSMSWKEFFSFPARTSLFTWQDSDSVLSKILDPESSDILPPNICSKKRIFLPKVPLPKDWRSELREAVTEGDLDKLRKLYAAGADLSSTYDSRRWSLLHWAAGEGHTKCVQWLIEQGLSVNVTGADGSAPLHWAAFRRNMETVQLLLDRGADRTGYTGYNRTPEDSLALSKESLDVADLLD